MARIFELFWAHLSFSGFTKSEFMRGSVRKVQNCTWTRKTTRVSLWGWSQRKFCVIRAGGMHGPPRLQSRQACLLQPRQHPYRDCIKSCRTMRGAAWTLRSFRLQGGHRVPFLVSRLWARSDACLPFLFQVFLEQCYSLGTAAIQRGFVSRKLW